MGYSVFEEDVKNCVAALQAGNTILYPTDTIWGIGCDALNKDAIEKVYTLKNRPKEKSLIVLLAEAKDIFQYVAAPHPDIISILESFTEPTTIIYEGALDFPDNVVNEDGSIAIRVTSDPFCKSLVKRFGGPIVSTSANFSGQPAPAFFKQIDKEIITNADYVVHYRQDDATPRKPSRLARIEVDSTVSYIR
jgi:L-threonylcarbamoyladenylate synthase